MITLYHLNKSRSKRIIWLLEELGVEYQIEAFQRDKETSLAPEALKAIHPLGKSPVIKDDDLVAATHGRSFWILDDLTPLRQLCGVSAMAALCGEFRDGTFTAENVSEKRRL